MKRLPTLISVGFITISLVRVAAFTSDNLGAGFLGPIFALCLGAAVYISAYMSRQHITRKDGKSDARDIGARRAAFASLIFFMLSDGLYNLAEVMQSITKDASALTQVAAVLYGIFPTVAVSLLGWLQGYVDRLPHISKPSAASRILAALADFSERKLAAQPAAIPVSEPGSAKKKRSSGNWRQLTIKQKEAIGAMETAEIVARHGISDRTARLWKERARSNGYHEAVKA